MVTELRNDLIEAQVLSAIMNDPTGSHFEDVAAVLTPEDFAHPRHELIYRTIAALVGEGRPHDTLFVIERLEAKGNLRMAGGDSFVFQISDSTLNGDNAGYYADMLRGLAVRRRVEAIGKTLTENAAGRLDLDPLVLLEQAQAALEAIEHPSRRGRSVMLAQIADEEFDALAKPPTYVPTPWRELNSLIDGWRPGALYVVGARTGAGKTMFGLNAAAHLSPHGVVPFLTIEMNRAELFSRVLANASEVPLQVLHRHAMTDTTWERGARALPNVKAARIEIHDGRYEGFDSFRRDLLQTRRNYGHIAAIVCDYLGLMLGPGSKDRWEKMSDLTSNLKALAREFDVPVIALSQLNRNSATGERAPTLTDLRDGGSVEQDADVVILMQREDGDHRGEVLNMNVAKNRHGREGKFELLFEGSLARLSNL